MSTDQDIPQHHNLQQYPRDTATSFTDTAFASNITVNTHINAPSALKTGGFPTPTLCKDVHIKDEICPLISQEQEIP